MRIGYCLGILWVAPVAIGEVEFEQQVLDPAISIGYGLAIGDVDGDGKADVILADQREFVWYRNGDWKRILIAKNLTLKDNVCIAARDIDGDGKVEIAVGANWNPGETDDEKASGAVFYLVRPEDVLTEEWHAVKLAHEPTVHRMGWVEAWEGEFRLLVLPLHGRGNRGGKGENGSRVLAYEVPEILADPAGWVTNVVEDRLHATHNFDVIRPDEGVEGESVAIGGAEGISRVGLAEEPGPLLITPENGGGLGGAGEVRFDPGTKETGWRYATVEPMHGNVVAVYSAKDGGGWARVVLDEALSGGHALAWGDLLGTGEAQVVAGWREKDKDGKVGIRLYARDKETGKWEARAVDDNTMACEDLKLADLDGDGRLDVVAAGRATKNLVIYWNRKE